MDQNNSEPLISVITPTYNRAHLISRAIESVINQTYTNWELIIVDDGSSDNLLEVINIYQKKDNRVKYIKNIENKGANYCRNIGILNSKGKYINFLDSDDILLKDKFKLQIESFKKEPKLDMVISDYLIRQDGLNDKPRTNVFSGKSLLVDFLSKKIKWVIHAPLWKKEFINKIGFFNETLSNAQDYEYYARAAILKPKIGYIKTFLVVQIIYPPTIDSTKIGYIKRDRMLKTKLYSRFLVSKHIKNSNLNIIEKTIAYWALIRQYFRIIYLLSKESVIGGINLFVSLLTWHLKS